MRIVFVGSSESHSGKHYRYRAWHLSTCYGYSLIFDPIILSALDKLPEIVPAGVDPPGDCDLIIASDRVVEGSPLEKTLCEASRAAVICVMPTRGVLLKHTAGSSLQIVKVVPSLKENWYLDPSGGHVYSYPYDLDFAIAQVDNSAQILSRIGECPDLVAAKGFGFFSTDAFAALASHVNEPVFPRLLSDFGLLLARGVSATLDLSLDVGMEDLVRHSDRARFQLRRDFHSVGYAYLTLREMAECRKDAGVSFARFEDALLEAASTYREDQPHHCEKALRGSFEELARRRRSITQKRIYYIDTIHAGGMFDDVGFFEFDWPESTAGFLDNMLSWREERSLAFCIDFSAASLKSFLMRYPRLRDRIRQGVSEGKIQIVNGTYAQPYPLLYSNESMIRQLAFGKETMEELFGCDIDVYASQEFGFCSNLPALLSLARYNYNVGRSYNQGEVPIAACPLVLWKAKDGSTIRTLPRHPYVSESEYDFTYANLHIKILEAINEEPEIVVSTAFGDTAYMRPFREELARVSHYAPVFGEFRTFKRYFDDFPDTDEVYYMRVDDLEFTGCFLDLERWGAIHAEHAGGNNHHHLIVNQAEWLFLCLESIWSTHSLIFGAAVPDMRKSWAHLLSYEGHDNYLVPFEYVGEYMANQGNLIHYAGPDRRITVREKCETDLDADMKAAKEDINRLLHEIGSRVFQAAENRTSYIVANIAPGREATVQLPVSGSFSLADGTPLTGQRTDTGTLVRLVLPGYGYLRIDRTETPAVWSSDGGGTPDPGAKSPTISESSQIILENRWYRFEIDRRSGIGRSLYDKRSGQLILKRFNRFVCPDAVMEASEVRLLADGPVRRTIEIHARLVRQGVTLARIATKIDLDVDSTVLSFTTVAEPLVDLRGNQWERSLGVAFETEDEAPDVFRNCTNILEVSERQRLNSLYLLRLQSEAWSVNLYNFGNQMYSVRRGCVENVLIFEHENQRSFRYGIELNAPFGVQEAMKAVLPLFITPLHRSSVESSEFSSPSAAGRGYYSAFRLEPENVLLTSQRTRDARIILTFNETAGRDTVVTLRSSLKIREAFFCDPWGHRAERHEESLLVHRGAIRFKIRRWGIEMLCVSVE